MFSRYPLAHLSSKFIVIKINALDEQELKEIIMDLSAVIVVMLAVLFFLGGVAWLEMHSRKTKASTAKVRSRRNQQI